MVLPSNTAMTFQGEYFVDLDGKETAKQTADECGGYIVVRNATFEDYISQGERWSKYIDYKEKHIWKLYNVK